MDAVKEKLMDPKDVAEITGCSVTKVKRMAKSGEIPMIRLGVCYRISRKAFWEWYDSLTKSAQVQQKRA